LIGLDVSNPLKLQLNSLSAMDSQGQISFLNISDSAHSMRGNFLIAMAMTVSDERSPHKSQKWKRARISPKCDCFSGSRTGHFVLRSAAVCDLRNKMFLTELHMTAESVVR
jgi:hypothetical protein